MTQTIQPRSLPSMPYKKEIENKHARIPFAEAKNKPENFVPLYAEVCESLNNLNILLERLYSVIKTKKIEMESNLKKKE